MKTYPPFSTQFGDAFSMGIRHNNPGNIRYDKTNTWIGQIGSTTNGFCIFLTPVHGLRAMAKIILRYRNEYHLVRSEQIIDRYDTSPNPNHMNYRNYVRGQCRVYGCHTIDNDACIVELMFHMIAFETGQKPYTRELIDKSLELAKHT